MKKLVSFGLMLELVLMFLAIVPPDASAKGRFFTLLEKTRGAEIILLAKCTKIQDEKYALEIPPWKEFKADRFALYKITETWKGKHDKDTIILDYKLTNEKYRPSWEDSPAVQPVIDEQVVLFIEKDSAIFAGSQGKIQVDEERIPLYKDAIKKFLELDTLTGREKVLFAIRMIDDNNPYSKQSALRELGEIDNTTYGIEIAGLLKHKDVEVRQSAINALVRTKERAVVPLVIEALEDSNPVIRREAATVLWRIPDERITPALMKAFNDEDAGVRAEVIFALSRSIGSIEAIPLYLKALKDVDPLVRANGANAFNGMWGSNSPELLDALKDENAMVRRAAVSSLRLYVSPAIIEPVSALLDDENELVRQYAASCITAIARKGYQDSLKKDKIIDDLLRMSEKEEKFWVKSTAIEALGAIGSKRAIPVLLNLLSDAEVPTRVSAVLALSSFGEETVLPYLKKALENEKDEYVKGRIKTAITKLEKGNR